VYKPPVGKVAEVTALKEVRRGGMGRSTLSDTSLIGLSNQRCAPGQTLKFSDSPHDFASLFGTHGAVSDFYARGAL